MDRPLMQRLRQHVLRQQLAPAHSPINWFVLQKRALWAISPWLMIFGSLLPNSRLDSAPVDVALFERVLDSWAQFVPHLLIIFLGSTLIEKALSIWQRREIDPLHWYHAALMSVLLPLGIGWPLLLIGMLFGLVFGRVMFGGAGNYLINPALLAVVFLHLSYPQHYSVIELLQLDGAPSWFVAAALAMGWLMQTRWRQYPRWLLAGVLLGGVFSAVLFRWQGVAYDGWYSTMVLNTNLWVLLIFVLPDASVQPFTRVGKLLFATLFLLLVSVFQLGNPEAISAPLYALMLASLLVPLLDRLVVSAHRLSTHQQRSSA